MIALDEIKKLHIEITTRCQARCPMCPRNYRGTNYNSGYPETELTADDIAKIVDPIKDQLTFIYFNGNLGDFSSAREAKEAVQWLVNNTSADITIMTNGSARTPQWWAELAHPRVTITFDLDGLSDTHHLYRIATDWNKTVANAKAFIANGGNAIWQMIPFDHNRHQIDECKQLAKDLGFVDFSLIDHGGNRGPVYNLNGEFMYWIGEPDPHIPPIEDLLRSHENQYNKVNKESIAPNKIACHTKRQSEIYLAADGTVYPCCYLGFYPATMRHPGNEQIKAIQFENNALEHGLAHAIQWFNGVESSWSKSSVADGLLYQCATSCGRN